MKKRPEILPDWIRRLAKDWKTRKKKYVVWVMEDAGLAYMPVPKVASSSIRNAIRERMGPQLMGERWQGRKDDKVWLEKRIRLSLSPEEVLVRRKEMCFFTFVRNPLTRLFSCYRDKVVNAAERRQKCTLSPYGIHFGMSFDDFIRCVAEIPDSRSDQHFCSQHRFVAHDGSLLVDYVGKIETFAEDWRWLEDRFGVPQPAHSKRVSGAVMDATALPLSRKAAELAIRRYADDIELFGYEQELGLVVSQLH